MAESHRLVTPRKILVQDLNTCLTCTLCGGYFVDATTVVDCSHTFCRACIVRHFESSRLCPSCGSLVHKSKPLSKLRSDPTLQSLVYKVVPALYSKELQRRADFYHSTGFRANSSCSDDSVLGDRTQDNEEWAASNIGDPSLYFSPDDSISLSVEYYTKEESDSETEPKPDTKPADTASSDNPTITNNNNINSSSDAIKTELTNTQSDPASEQSANSDKTTSDKTDTDASAVGSRDAGSGEVGDESEVFVKGLGHKRFLQCPAAVRMSHLMKFIRMKFALSNEHRVDIIYSGEVLPPYLSLMDVAYTFKWNREKPMRFFYLIYIPTIRPAVPQQPEHQPPPEVPEPAPALPPPIPPLKIEIPNNKLDIKIEKQTSPADTKISKKHKEIKIKEPVKPEVVDVKNEDNNNHKVSPKSKPEKSEKPLNNDSKSVQKTVKFIDKYTSKSNNIEYKIKTNDSLQGGTGENCVYEYAEPDKDEIKAFAERRDREWAMQKYPEVHVSKKRKKSKHSKNESMHKKRKLHAEITSNEVSSNADDSLKLKVKFSVANGHKHKHRSSSSSIATIEPVKTQELSPKERLLQMRQVRHKQVAPTVDEKTKTAFSEPNIKMVITSEKLPEKSESPRVPEKPETSPKTSDQKTPDIFTTGKTLRSDFSNKTSLSKDICNKYVRVSLEKFGEKTSPPKKIPVSNNLSMSKVSEKIDTKDETKSRNVDGKTEIIPMEHKTVDNNKVNSNTNNKLSDTTLSIKPTDNKSNGSKIIDKVNTNNKILDNKINKIPTKPNDVKSNDRTNLIKTENKTPDQKFNSKSVDQINNFKAVEHKIINKTNDTKVVPNKTTEQTKMTPKTVESKLLSSKLLPKAVPKTVPRTTPKTNEQKPTIDESKAIENKLNNIDFKTSQSSTLVTKNFTVSKVETGTKRKLESPEVASDKRPSLEITVINLVSRPSQTSGIQTNAVQSKPASNTQTKSSVSISPEGPPAKKIRPPPLTIPLGRIQKMNSVNKSNLQKPPEKCDIFGALDLSAKPTNKPEMKTNEFRAHSASPKAKIQDQIQSMIRPKTPIKTGQDVKTDPTKSLDKMQRPNISNLQMLSESAVQIRELMAKGSPISSIPNLIKKIPSPIGQNSGAKNSDYLQKGPNFQQKTPNLIPKTPTPIPKNMNNLPARTPNFLSKNLQKLPKLNEINKGQFCRLNSGQQVRPPRPAGQNQTVRNIPNPSLLVRQQNQNRINSLNNSNSTNNHESQETVNVKTKLAPENTETEKRPSENKTSEPPPLKPIESFKK